MGAWLLLSGAVVLEIAATLMLKLSDGFEKWYWATAAILCYCACFFLFAPALKHIPVGVAYAIWAGAGIVAITVIGVVGFNDNLNMVQIGCIGLVLAGSVGLRLSTTV